MLTTTQVAEFYDRGWTVSDQLLSPEECSLIRMTFDSLEPEERSMEPGTMPLEIQYMRSYDVPMLRYYVSHPALVEIPLQLIGPDVAVLWDQAVSRSPGLAGVLPWHQDAGYSHSDPPESMITVWLAVTDAGSSNGGLKISQNFPGAAVPHVEAPHGLRSVAEQYFPSEADIITPQVKQGQAIVFSPFLLHSSGGAMCHERRQSWVLTYSDARARHGATGAPLTDRLTVAKDGEVTELTGSRERWQPSEAVTSGWVELDQTSPV